MINVRSIDLLIFELVSHFNSINLLSPLKGAVISLVIKVELMYKTVNGLALQKSCEVFRNVMKSTAIG